MAHHDVPHPRGEGAPDDEGSSTTQRTPLTLAQELSSRQWGVHPQRADVPYLHRSLETQLQAALERFQPTLVVGPCLSGKTRLCVEVLRTAYPTWPVLFPTSAAELPALLSSCVSLGQAILWLDDADRYLGRDGLTPVHVDDLRRRGWLTVATMRTSAYQPARPRGPRPPQARALTRFQILSLDNDDDERHQLASQVDAPDVRAGVSRYGLGPYLAGGDRVLQRYEKGRHRCPLGAALVRAAADCRRAGLVSVAASTLTELAPAYLAPGHPRCRTTSDAAVRWATAVDPHGTQLMQPGPEEHLRVGGYIADYLTGQHLPIPEATWTAINGSCSPQDAPTVAYTAHTLGRPDIAETLWRRAAADGDPAAANNLALLLDGQGHHDAAEALFRDAAEAGDPAATLNLGTLLHERGRTEQAEVLYQQALAEGELDALTCLGVLRHQQGALREAETLYRAAMAAGRPQAVNNLAVLLSDRGQAREADALWQQGVDAGDPGALTNYGVLQHDQGHHDQAELLLQRAVNVGDVGAMYNLGILRYEANDYIAAETLWRQAAQAGDASAAHNLTVLHQQQAQQHSAGADPQ